MIIQVPWKPNYSITLSFSKRPSDLVLQTCQGQG